MSDDVTVPRQRDGTELWPTSHVCALVAQARGITPESARRWLTRNRRLRPVNREVGREGENQYVAAMVRVVLGIDPSG